MLRKPWLWAVALTLLIIPGPACAQMMNHGGMMGDGMDGPMRDHMAGHMDDSMEGAMGHMPLFLRAARLTPDQDKQVRKILDDSRLAFGKLFQQMHSARKQMAEKLLAPDPVSAKDLAPEVAEINQAQQQMLAEEVNIAMKIRAVLKPDQLRKIAAFHQQMKSLHDQMHALIAADCGGPAGGPPPPPDGGPPPPPQ